MLNPLEFRDTIDACIAEHIRDAQTFAVDCVTDSILATLQPVDRRGIDRELLTLIATVRASSRKHGANDLAAAA